MNRTATQYAAADRRLTDILDGVPAAGWTSPSPCEGWSARDVVGHLIETQRAFLTGRGLDLGAAPDVALDPAAAWREHATAVLGLISDDGVVAAGYDGVFGPTSIGDTLDRFYVFDMVVHRWDVARATGGDTGLSPDELDRIEAGADGFGDALYMEGVCRPGIEARAGADRAARLLARLGRRA
ncbi:TIGR03086 family metal-binding protein [Geodermatophilus ruber]|uniref:TIGR03086 family protein n=1 Tax=Geodermatophilus ruber TaxID=504800 RepID=A0A1I4FM81_9ACTN|nr:TIGR03086 family metal-binding protein [Geodermatophilus ruber]SFL18420.1 TIGR03086 family protein [Geodermatophilus ruber]